jgi:hypothetical protein
MEWSGHAPALPAANAARGTEDKERAMSQKLDTSPVRNRYRRRGRAASAVHQGKRSSEHSDDKLEWRLETGAQLLRHYFALLRLWRTKIDERALLEGLQEFELKEFGSTRQSRRLEVDKPFWR